MFKDGKAVENLPLIHWQIILFTNMKFFQIILMRFPEGGEFKKKWHVRSCESDDSSNNVAPQQFVFEFIKLDILSFLFFKAPWLFYNETYSWYLWLAQPLNTL